jgi:hypothetical protein
MRCFAPSNSKVRAEPTLTCRSSSTAVHLSTRHRRSSSSCPRRSATTPSSSLQTSKMSDISIAKLDALVQEGIVWASQHGLVSNCRFFFFHPFCAGQLCMCTQRHLIASCGTLHHAPVYITHPADDQAPSSTVVAAYACASHAQLPPIVQTHLPIPLSTPLPPFFLPFFVNTQQVVGLGASSCPPVALIHAPLSLLPVAFPEERFKQVGMEPLVQQAVGRYLVRHAQSDSQYAIQVCKS